MNTDYNKHEVPEENWNENSKSDNYVLFGETIYYQ